jgi:HEAT repeat protein
MKSLKMFFVTLLLAPLVFSVSDGGGRRRLSPSERILYDAKVPLDDQSLLKVVSRFSLPVVPRPDPDGKASEAADEVVATYRAAVWVLHLRGNKDLSSVLWNAMEGKDKDTIRFARESLEQTVRAGDFDSLIGKAKKHQSVRVRDMALSLLARLLVRDLDPRRQQVFDVALHILQNDKSRLLRLHAVSLVRVASVNDKETVRILVASLHDKEHEPRGMSVASCAIANLGAIPAKEAVTALIKIAEGPDLAFRAAALFSMYNLARVKPGFADNLFPVCEKYLADRSQHLDVRCSAASALSGMGGRGARALASVLKEPGKLRADAVDYLATMGEKAEKALPELVLVINDKTEALETRRMAIQAVGRIGPAASTALPSLQQDFRDAFLNSEARNAVKRILKQEEQK